MSNTINFIKISCKTLGLTYKIWTEKCFDSKKHYKVVFGWQYPCFFSFVKFKILIIEFTVGKILSFTGGHSNILIQRFLLI